MEEYVCFVCEDEVCEDRDSQYSHEYLGIVKMDRRKDFRYEENEQEWEDNAYKKYRFMLTSVFKDIKSIFQ